jgi:hypothetical protein
VEGFDSMRFRLLAVELKERGNGAVNALASKDRFAMIRVTEALSVAMELAERIAGSGKVGHPG